MGDVTLEKEFPKNYSNDVVKVLNLLQLGDDLQVVGSASLRSQIYAGDFDCIEDVDLKGKTSMAALNAGVHSFQKMVAEIAASPTIWLSDIKAGIVEELRIVPECARIEGDAVVGWDAAAAKERVAAMLAAKQISATEAGLVVSLIRTSPSVEQFSELVNAAKFHIVRWTADEVKRNSKRLRTGKTLDLQTAFTSPSVVKVDVVAVTGDNRLTEFSCIYRFLYKGKPFNDFTIDYKRDLTEDINRLINTNQYFKALKRAFSLAKVEDDVAKMNKLSEILNSDLGRLYQVVGDMRTLAEFLLEHTSGRLPIIETEIEQFTRRLSNIYTIPSYLKAEPAVLKSLQKALATGSSQKKAKMLEDIADDLDTILQARTKKLLKL